jgi:gamma-glutamyltranspeptidase
VSPARWPPGTARAPLRHRSLGAPFARPPRRRARLHRRRHVPLAVNDNAAAFGQFSSTSALYLPGGHRRRRHDLPQSGPGPHVRPHRPARPDAFYRGEIGRDIVATVADPPWPRSPWVLGVPDPARRDGRSDLSGYAVREPAPTKIGYRGYDVYGMATPSSGGQAVGEALNILERFDLAAMTRTQALHHYLEASALAFADRNRYVGDGTPRPLLDQLLSDGFAAERACRSTRPRAHQAGRAGHPGRLVRRLPHGHRLGAGPGRSVHHQPDRRRPVGQRGRVHADHRADRRQRDGGAGRGSCSTTS